MVEPSLMEREENNGRRVDRSRRGPLIRWAHQRQKNLIDNLLDSLVRQGLEGHQDRTQEELDTRNTALAAMQASGKAPPRAEQSRQVHNSLRLPDYTRWLHEEHRN